jgi:hypothetical protein
MGDEIYIENLKKYSKTINLALKVSKLAANRQAENKIVWACILYTRICVTVDIPVKMTSLLRMKLTTHTRLSPSYYFQA